MGKWFFLLVLIVIALAACGIFANFSDAPTEIASEAADVQRYKMQLEATIAAATPSSVELLNQNREGLYDYNIEESESGGGLGFLVVMIIVDLFLLLILLAQNSEGTLKQIRLIQKQLGGGKRHAPVGRTRTLPQIPYLNQTPGYRQLPEQASEMSNEVDWYE